MTDIKPITDKASHKAELSRLDEAFHSDAETAEGREIRALAQVIHDYEQATFAIRNTPTDAVFEIECMLDEELADLPGLVDIFGGQEPFIKFMLRERPLDDGTIDAIVAAYDVERDLLDKPFCEPPGVQAITMEGQEPCKDPICCPPNRHNWREDLQETLAAVLEQRG